MTAARKERSNALFVHRFIFRLALATGNIFAWVIVFRVFFMTTRDLDNSLELSLAGVAALYVLSHLVTFFLTPLSGMALRRGVRRALIIGTLVTAGSFGILATLFLDPYFVNHFFS